MKIASLLLIQLCTILTFNACEKPDAIPSGAANQLSDIWISIPNKGAAETKYNGIFNETGDTIFFKLPAEFPAGSGTKPDLTQLMIRANIPVNARVNPSLSGPQDLSKPLQLSVTAGNGTTRNVVLAVAQTQTTTPAADLRCNALHGRAAKIDPSYSYYKNRSAESIADELSLAGYKAVHYMVVNELDVRADLVDALHQKGIAVWLMVFANGTYSAWGFPAGWENWKMGVLNPGTVAAGFTYFSPFSSSYVSWKKQTLASIVSTIPFDGVELFEAFFPEFAWNGIANSHYGDIGPNAQAAFQQKYNLPIPNFTNSSDPNYYQTNSTLYNKWMQFRVDGLKDMHNEIFNGANGIRSVRPDILVGAWALGINWGGAVPLLRELQGQDVASIIQAINPDIYFLETHWPDWTKANLQPDYIQTYQPVVDAIRAAAPLIPVGIQTDYGSQRQMIRSKAWMDQFDIAAVQKGYSSYMGYEYHIGGNMYQVKPGPLKAVRQSNTSIIISFNKRIDSTTATNASNYVFRQNGASLSIQPTAISVDGNRVILQAGNFPTGSFQVAVSNIQDTPPLWLFTDFPANVVVPQSEVTVP
ncbi:N-acyl-D-glucosamine 2-epimerase [Chitinophaga qingshengii]|uniref:N-acyl-D-glucosamine 2-epimerase n=1 Tax=Chitinophaga qingshengii TaxID=1569794 RepID=A0ABR7TH44_9BACT|nr:N-acyl-D-glucosamine 2-epimerase [Chitinophaga qingshengii]MBC9929253.1 N-acyl-D-glucosamine 2-epimerase [Chitinophaga qingshengii]